MTQVPTLWSFPSPAVYDVHSLGIHKSQYHELTKHDFHKRTAAKGPAPHDEFSSIPLHAVAAPAGSRGAVGAVGGGGGGGATSGVSGSPGARSAHPSPSAGATKTAAAAGPGGNNSNSSPRSGRKQSPTKSGASAGSRTSKTRPVAGHGLESDYPARRSFVPPPPALNLSSILSVPESYSLSSRRTARPYEPMAAAEPPPLYASEVVAEQAVEEHHIYLDRFVAPLATARTVRGPSAAHAAPSGAATARARFSSTASAGGDARRPTSVGQLVTASPLPSTPGSTAAAGVGAGSGATAVGAAVGTGTPVGAMEMPASPAAEATRVPLASRGSILIPALQRRSTAVSAMTGAGAVEPVQSARAELLSRRSQRGSTAAGLTSRSVAGSVSGGAAAGAGATPPQPVTDVRNLCDDNAEDVLHEGTLHAVANPEYGVSDVTAETIARRCRYLESLDLSHCTAVSPQALVGIGVVCRGLAALRLCDLPQLQSGTLAVLMRELLHLQSVDVSGCVRVGDASAREWEMCVPLRSLHTLKLSRCVAVSDAFVGLLARLCPALQTLHLAHCANVSDAGIESLAPQVPQLCELDLTGCRRVGDVAVRALASRCNQLRVLRLAQCVTVSDACARALCTGLPGLEELDLSSTRATDFFVRSLASHVPTLRRLVLRRCDVRGRFKSRVVMPALQQLDLSESSIGEWHAVCASLTHLRLVGCADVTDAFVASLADTCPVLRELHLSGCPRITDATPVSVGVSKARWPCLRVLMLDGCPQVTPEAVAQTRTLMHGAAPVSSKRSA